VFTNPMPGPEYLQAYYSAIYRQLYKGTWTPKLKHIYRAGLRALERVERLGNYVPLGAQVFDVGAGGGEFIYLLHKHGYGASGIEPSEAYVAFSIQQYGIKVETGYVETFWMADSSVDAITMHHVLEHLADPKYALTRIKAWLKPGGHAIIEVPNLESRFHSPGHRFHFAHLQNFHQSGIEQLARTCGFAVIDCRLSPGTEHINIVLQNESNEPTGNNYFSYYEKAKDSLERHTYLSHILSIRPYNRLWANITRPLRERREMRRLGSPQSGNDVLEALHRKSKI